MPTGWTWRSARNSDPGPLISTDLEDGETNVAGGFIAGVGLDDWLTPRWGVGSDANDRLLVGDDTRNVLTLSFGFSLRL
jgi:hypothetical protein